MKSIDKGDMPDVNLEPVPEEEKQKEGLLPEAVFTDGWEPQTEPEPLPSAIGETAPESSTENPQEPSAQALAAEGDVPQEAKQAPTPEAAQENAEAPSVPDAPAEELPVGLAATMSSKKANEPDLGILQFNEHAEVCAGATAGWLAACCRLLAARMSIMHAGWTGAMCRSCGMDCQVRRGQCRDTDFWLEWAFRRMTASSGEKPKYFKTADVVRELKRRAASEAEKHPEVV